jgi:hypothetical protein
MFADEMRLGQVRRVWGRRGEKQRRRIELQYAWVYLVLGVDPMKGRLGLHEAGAGGGDSSGAQGVEGGRGEGRGMRPCGLSQGEGGVRGATTVGSREEGLIAGRVALHPSSFECPAFMMKKLCI